MYQRQHVKLKLTQVNKSTIYIADPLQNCVYIKIHVIEAYY